MARGSEIQAEDHWIGIQGNLASQVGAERITGMTRAILEKSICRLGQRFLIQ
jgi:hypothetical protein